jgi:hypothetical protein
LQMARGLLNDDGLEAVADGALIRRVGQAGYPPAETGDVTGLKGS